MATERCEEHHPESEIQPAPLPVPVPVPVPVFNLDVPRESSRGLFARSRNGDGDDVIEPADPATNGNGNGDGRGHGPPGRSRPLVRRMLFASEALDPEQDPGPPPDGGLAAWTQVAMGHLVIIVTWGWISSYGVFQTYYVQTLNHPPADISWVGSVQIFLLFGIGTFAGRATDAGYFRAVFGTGIALQLLGVFGSSVATTYWQLLLSQGIATGCGNGLLFCPTFAVIPQYFDKKRALALACVSAGTSTGGLLFPGIVEALLPRLGFGWTIRAVGFVMAASLAAAGLLMRPRLPPREKGPLVDTAALREPMYVLFAVGVFAMFLGIYPAFYYVGEYATSVLHADQAASIHLLLVMNGVGLPARPLAGYIADRWVGSLTLLVASTAVSAAIMYAWLAVRDYAGLVAFAAVYGVAAAAMQGLFIPALAGLTTDLKKMGTRMGMVFSFVSFASVAGSPVAGALIQTNGGRYLSAQLFAATCLVAAALVMMLAQMASKVRTVRVRPDAVQLQPSA